MFVKAKEFSNISFHSISKRGWPNLLLYHNTQPMKGILVLLDEEDEVFKGNPSPKFHHPSEILRKVDPLLFCKPERPFHGETQDHSCLLCSANHQNNRPNSNLVLVDSNGQPLPPLRSSPP